MVSLTKRRRLEERVVQLNQKLKQLEISQLQFVFDKEFETVHLFYTCDHYTDWVGSVVDTRLSEILDWLEVQEARFTLYKQLIAYFGSDFAYAVISNDSSVELTLKHLTYYFSYDDGSLVVTVYKHYVGKGLTKLGSKVGNLLVLLLGRVRFPHRKKCFSN